MKRLLILAPLLLLAACNEPKVDHVEPQVALPEDLKDCKFYEVRLYKDGPNLKIARCPNSTTSTTYQVGKGTGTTVTVEGPIATPGPAPVASAPAVSEKAIAQARGNAMAEAQKMARQRALEKLTTDDLKALGLL